MSADDSFCDEDHCWAPDSACIYGHALDECPNITGEISDTDTEGRERFKFPWSGLALGTNDLPSVSALSRARLIGIVGASNAGKTTALSALLLRLRRGHKVGSWQFSGSLSLRGWYSRIRHLEWDAEGPAFPPHTSSGEVRKPSLLHLRLADAASERERDILISDAPGEWFSRWAVNESAVPGAVWLAEHADVFVLFADSNALRGEGRGSARAEYEQLATRLAGAVDREPVIPVWAKSDLSVSDSTRTQIGEINSRLFGRSGRPLCIAPTEDQPLKLEPLDEMINMAVRSPRVEYRSTLPRSWKRDAFLAGKE